MRSWCQQRRGDCHVLLGSGRVSEHHRSNIPTKFAGHVIPVADKDAQFVDLETFEGVEDFEDELGVDLLEIAYLHMLYALLLLGNQRLVTFQLIEVVLDVDINDRHDLYDPFHNVVLDEDVSPSLNDTSILCDPLILVDN